MHQAMSMAQSALAGWMAYLPTTGQSIPLPSDIRATPHGSGEFVSLIDVTVRENRAVKRTVSLPEWMDAQASNAGLSLSKVLQDALAQKFQ